LARVLEGDLSDDHVLADAVARLAAHPATDEAAAIAVSWAQAAMAELEVVPASAATRALTAFAETATSRLS
jgi:heptaprenyl diphosphate synthase